MMGEIAERRWLLNAGKILIIDDNEQVLAATSIALEMEGYSVVTTKDPFCTGLIVEERPDIILLDVNMPMIQGDAMGKVLAGATAFLGKTIILFHSNLSEDELRQKAKFAGVDGYIPKASDPGVLFSQIAQWMAVSRSKIKV
jgi:chemotaxis family two-component system response regulator PixG